MHVLLIEQHIDSFYDFNKCYFLHIDAINALYVHIW